MITVEEQKFAKENESFCTNTYPRIGEGVFIVALSLIISGLRIIKEAILK